LSGGERADLNAADGYRTDSHTFAQQWRCQNGPLPEALLESLADRELVVGLSREVVDVDRLPVDDGSASYRAAVARHTLVHPWEWPIMGFQPKNITIDAVDKRIVGSTHPCGTLCHGIEHRLKVGWRTGDHPENVARCRLPFE